MYASTVSLFSLLTISSCGVDSIDGMSECTRAATRTSTQKTPTLGDTKSILFTAWQDIKHVNLNSTFNGDS